MTLPERNPRRGSWTMRKRFMMATNACCVGTLGLLLVLSGCATAPVAQPEAGAPAVADAGAGEMESPHGKKKDVPDISPWPDDTVVMKLGARDVTYKTMKEDFEKDWAGKPLTLLEQPQQEEFFRKYYIQKLFAQEARARGLQNSQYFRDHSRASRIRTLVPFLKSIEYGEKITPSDEELLQYLPPAEDSVRVRIILKKESADAKKVYERALAGEDFVALCMAESEGFLREAGGLTKWMSPHNTEKFAPPVVERFLAQPVGAVLEPFYSDVGFVVVQIADKKSADAMRRDELAVQRGEILKKIRDTLYEDCFKKLLAESTVAIHDDVVKAHEAGQGAGDHGAVIVEVNGASYLASEVLEEMIAAGHGGKAVAQRVKRFVEDAILSQEAVRLGYDTHPEFLKAWEVKESALLASEMVRVENEAVAAEPVTGEEADAYIKANADKYMTPELRCVKAILVNSQEKSAEVEKRLGAGEDFSALAREASIDADSAAKDGLLGCFDKKTLPVPFQEPVFALEPGGMIGTPIEVASDKGEPLWFFFKLDSVRNPALADRDSVNMRKVEDKVRTLKRANRLNALVQTASATHGYSLCITSSARKDGME